MVAGIKEKVCVHDGEEAGTAEEEEESWRERDQMAAQWEEEQKLEEILEQRRMEGSSVQLEVMRNVLE